MKHLAVDDPESLLLDLLLVVWIDLSGTVVISHLRLGYHVVAVKLGTWWISSLDFLCTRVGNTGNESLSEIVRGRIDSIDNVFANGYITREPRIVIPPTPLSDLIRCLSSSTMHVVEETSRD